MLAATTIVYYALQLAGLLLLAILTITFAVPQGPSRHLTIPNQNLIWIIQAIVSCLLLFSGHADSEQIPQGLCKVQSAIVYGAPPALSAAALAVVARLWLLTFTVDKAKSLLVPNSPWFTVGLVALPYVAWIIVAVLAGVIAGENVRRFPQYCASDNQVPSIISGIGAAFLLIVAATLQIWTLVIVGARYRRTRKLGSREIGNIDVALFMRISMFSSLIVIALVLAIVAIVSSWSQAAPDLLIAGMGPICFFIFGTQRDVLVCWHMAKKQQFASRSHTGTPGNTFASITAGQRSVPLGGVGSAGHAYGTDGWDMERDIAHHQAGIRSPTLVISSSNKRSMADSDTEDIEMGDTKARQVDGTAAEEGLRTVRVLSFDTNAQPDNHDLDDVPPTPPPKSYQI
ncbi:hypothetical protein M407DRAFT_224684 [Tulasnella calospora MUT 4182]|uniref:G-protein coupled receptors family 2 profile 2 domain-containing protein n=1 Tax=Tulasnella calospora MUT 4182 TaxID=1051891 RepID=A0A0C3QRC9_9AGAM|nr:hypothetical protein M407DRAFT_224684 [Tulasnella calospora MUT 4182]